MQDASAALTKLGFTETEAQIYCDLLRRPDATGYAIAKALKKSQANIYSALATLEVKGAVSFENGAVKTYRAVATHELFSRLDRDLRAAFAAAQRALADMAGPAKTDQIHQLANAEQVYERAAAMCDHSSVSVAFALFPTPFERLKFPLAKAVERGVGVAGVTFAEGDRLDGATCVPSLKISRAGSWPGQQLTLITDAREALVALFDSRTSQVLHAVYTDSDYLSCLLHAATVDAIILSQQDSEMLRVSFNKRLFGRIPTGFLNLLAETAPR